MDYWVQTYSFIRKDWVTATAFKGGVGGGQRIVTDNEQYAIDIFNAFIETQKGRGYAEYRLRKSWTENFRYIKGCTVLSKTVK